LPRLLGDCEHIAAAVVGALEGLIAVCANLSEVDGALGGHLNKGKFMYVYAIQDQPKRICRPHYYFEGRFLTRSETFRGRQCIGRTAIYGALNMAVVLLPPAHILENGQFLSNF
jgi:hypothetical protein